jgi:hypothetical protein
MTSPDLPPVTLEQRYGMAKTRFLCRSANGMTGILAEKLGFCTGVLDLSFESFGNFAGVLLSIEAHH